MPDVPIRDLLSKRITGYVNWHRNRRKHLFGNTLELLLEQMQTHAPDHVAVTGDLVNLATEVEIRNAALWLSGVGKPTDVSVVRATMTPTCRVLPAAPQPLGTTTWPATGTCSLRRGSSPMSADRKGRHRRLLDGGCHAALLGDGYFSGGQARRTLDLLRQLGDEASPASVLHSPPTNPGCRGQSQAHWSASAASPPSMREAGAELVLHGHTHLNTRYTLAGRDGPVP